MNKALFFFLFLSIFTVDRSSAQIIDRYKTNSAGKVTIDQVVQVDSTTTADQLYIRAEKFMTTYWKSAKDVTQLDDKESGIITTSGYAEVNNKKIHFGSLMKMYYTFTVYVKQGRYKIEFTSIEFQYYPTDLNPMPGKVLAEQMFSKQEFYKSNGKPHPKNEGFMIELDATFKRTGDALKKARTTYRDWETDRKSTRLNSSHSAKSRMPSSA